MVKHTQTIRRQTWLCLTILFDHCLIVLDHFVGLAVKGLIVTLEEASKSLLTRFDNILTKSNTDKCHLSVSSNEKETIKIGNHEIASTERYKLFGVHLDNGLSFGYRISEICKKASRKVCALARVTSGMSLSKKHTLMNAFFNSQFNYCSLIWMCHSHENNNKINRLHERCLIII